MDGNGWLDSGQHFTVSRGGFVPEGRAGSLAALRGGTQQVVGAHSPGENGRAIGIENEGIYVDEAPPAPMLAGLGAHVLFGHWDFRETQCPGIEFYKLFPKVRRDVARALGQRYATIPARTWPNILSPSTGPVVRLAQYLLRTHGYAVRPTGTFLLPKGYQLELTGAFDVPTREAVRKLRRRHGLEPDARVDLTTWCAAAGGVVRQEFRR